MKITLTTDRLILRPWSIDDAEDMFYGWASDQEVTKYLTWKTHENIETTKMVLSNWIKEYEKPERINCAIVLKENNRLIGGIDVVGYLEGTPVIGYNIARNCWGNGYMTEACKCLVNYLFSLGHKKVRIDAAVDNIASNRVIQKCGGTFQRQELHDRPLYGDKMLINSYLIEKKD